MTERTTYAVWRDGAFHPRPGFHAARCAEWFGEGETIVLTVEQERDWIAHKKQFARISTAWSNLPEKYSDETWAQSAEHLRKYALIQTGFCDTQTYVCSSEAEARRWAKNMRPLDEYGIVLARGTTVVRYAAKSQSYRAMDRAEFQKADRAVIEWLSGLIGVHPDALREQAA